MHINWIIPAILLGLVVLVMLLRLIGGKERQLLRDTGRKYRYLKKLTAQLSERAAGGMALHPGSEWLLDNFYLVERKVKALHMDLTHSLYQKLTRFLGKPVILSCARAICEACSYQVDQAAIIQGLQEFQKRQALKSSDIWALSLMLYVVILGKIYEIGLRLDAWEGACPADAQETEELAACFGSLVTINTVDFTRVFDRASKLERVLSRDPSGTYPKMDFGSRDHYRHRIERLAKRFRTTEVDVAKKAVSLARAPQNRTEPCRRHIGYYLLGEGLSDLCGAYGKTPFALWIARQAGRHRTGLYLSALGLATLAVSALLAFCLHWASASLWLALGMAILFLLPASDIAVRTVNWLLLHALPIQFVPKLALEGGIPSEGATFVIVPTLLTDKDQAVQLVKNLEVFYHANSEDNLFFALVGDFGDSPSASGDADQEIIDAVNAEIVRLNGQYGPKFFYFHRHRTFNPATQLYTGWERKRGAILEFVRLLRGEETSYQVTSCALSEVPRPQYILTLDADTQLLRGSAKKLIGAMLHPLNQPVLNKEKTRVVRGYGMLQPRIGVDADSSHRSQFAMAFAGQGGIDPYSCAVSDIYQDLFGEGIFTGKGIFSVDVYYALLNHAIPSNRVLSHDLLEGSYLRCGLVSDVLLQDGFPHKYSSYMSRYHRWVRGDWQLLPYLSRTIRDGLGQIIPNPLPGIARWKMADNLRRSLLAPLLLVAVLVAFLLPGPCPWVLLAFVAAALLLSLVTLTVDAVLGIPPASRIVHYHTRFWHSVGRVLAEAGLLLAFLPYQAYVAVDAILRTLYRLAVKNRNMLEWVTASEADKRGKNSLKSAYAKMWFSPVAGVAALLLAIFFAPPCIPLGVVLLLLWCMAPWLSYVLSRERTNRFVLSAEDTDYLRMLARRTWRYFEEFAGPEDHFLPPDNFQEEPANGIAHRTSPTNMGLLLASTVTARDFGYLTTDRMLWLLEQTLTTIAGLETWNGHLLNWYDTRTLKPLAPRYVSTVDNGNYICYLIAVKEALTKWLDRPIFDKAQLSGLLDTAKLANEEGAEIDVTGLLGLAGEEFRAVELKTQLTQLLSRPFGHTGWGGRFARMAEALYEQLTLHGCDNPTLFEADGPRTQALIHRLDGMIRGTSFRPLFDEARQLFTIGYDVEAGKLSDNHYDLLATEARQTSFIAVAHGDVSEKHWMKLARGLTAAGGGLSLVSWTGTMFEYLMPLLLLRAREGTLWDETYRAAVAEHRRFGKSRGKVWGISECAFYSFDVDLNYQYKAVGVPGLGLRRGLGKDYVAASYATMLALMVAPQAATENLHALERLGMLGDYGMYESLDYAPRHLYTGEDYAVVQSDMAHHQGMSLLALNNLLHNGIMQARFESDPQVKAACSLLEETIPGRVVLSDHQQETEAPQQETDDRLTLYREELPSQASVPKCNLLSNGRYAVLITDRGTGWSKCRDTLLTRIRADAIQNDAGILLYVRDSGGWSGPALGTPMAATFQSNLARLSYQTETLTVRTDVYAAPRDNVEIREVELESCTGMAHRASVMSYFPVTLAGALSDEAHPAFLGLFVRTEYDESRRLLIAERRPRGGTGRPIYAGHFVTGQTEAISFETDRRAFLGRGRYPGNAQAMEQEALSGTAGAVLDPVMSLRVDVCADRTARLAFVTLYAESREEVLALWQKYADPKRYPAIREGAQNRSRAENRYLGISGEQEGRFLSLLSALTFQTPHKRRYADIVRKNRYGQQELWQHGISGDNPILLYQAGTGEDTDVLDEVVKAFLYLRFKGMAADLVILYEDGGYWDKTGGAVESVLAANNAGPLKNVRGGIYVLNAAGIDPAYCDLLVTVARVVLGSGSDLDSLYPALPSLPAPAQFGSSMPLPPPADIRPGQLTMQNGYGGMDGEEVVITLSDGAHTPLPWSNVVANETFGFVATESGGGYTWAENSRENKLTPWYNDPVSDPQGEWVCVRDEADGKLYAPTQQPFMDGGDYVVRYGFGYCVYTHAVPGLTLTLRQFVPTEDPVKLSLLTLTNTADTPRTFSVYYYAKPLMGGLESMTDPYLVTGSDERCGIWARNSYNSEFGGRILFLGATEPVRAVTGDRRDFLPLSDGTPAALTAHTLSGRTGVGLDACLAIQLTVTLGGGETRSVGLRLGQGLSEEETHALSQKYADTEAMAAALSEVRDYWRHTLSAVAVKTPDPHMDVLLNGWLLYQVLCCRMLARSAFYQSGGAYGYRDQLQDSLALLYADPLLTRQQILLHAAHQFPEGDVQHWWHPNPKTDAPDADKGIRTRFSDDLLWLPYVTSCYATATGDVTILDEMAPYIEGDPLPDGVDEHYAIPRKSEQSDTVYAHCLRAIDRALRTGPHGLPLMGSGDWNDGMNTVGNGGRGESVWLGWFLCDVLKRFVPLAEARADQTHAARYREALAALREALDTEGWDGAWYRRAYFDDGTPLGAAGSKECEIDSIAQSWAVISGAGREEKVSSALAHAYDRLVDPDAGIVKLLDPPFVQSDPSPGYIMSYLPGVRENGGQYSHAAVWLLLAFAMRGDGERAAVLADMLNPLRHADGKAEADRYMAEPYVMAADVYSAPPHAGRAGWTWYTGAAGWYYRAMLEGILGFQKQENTLSIRPCIPREWPGFSLTFRFGAATYQITVENPHHLSCGAPHITVDGVACREIALTDDGKTHTVEVTLAAQ